MICLNFPFRASFAYAFNWWFFRDWTQFDVKSLDDVIIVNFYKTMYWPTKWLKMATKYHSKGWNQTLYGSGDKKWQRRENLRPLQLPHFHFAPMQCSQNQKFYIFCLLTTRLEFRRLFLTFSFICEDPASSLKVR